MVCVRGAGPGRPGARAPASAAAYSVPEVMPHMGPFSDLVYAPLGRRAGKPRRVGLTVVMDKGLGTEQTRDLLAATGEYIDLWKSCSNWVPHRISHRPPLW